RKYIWVSLVFILVGLIFLIIWHPTSVSGRFFIWIVCGYMILIQPQGWGLFAFQKHYLDQQIEFIHNYPELCSYFNINTVHSAFNEFLNIGVSLGLAGLILYVFLMVGLFMILHGTKTIFLYPFISFLVVSISYFPFQIAPIMAIMILLCTAGISSSNRGKIYTLKHLNPFFICLLTEISAFIMIGNYQIYQKWKKAIDYKLPESGIFFSTIHETLQDNGLYLISHARYMNITGEQDKTLELLERADQFYSGINLSCLLSSAYERNKCLDKAEEQLKKAVLLSNGDYSMTYQLISFYLRTNNREKAVSLAVDLYNRPTSQAYYMDQYIIRKKLEELIEEQLTSHENPADAVQTKG
ncbi:MAG: hypothetical protein LUD68_04445, partial [Rikenellaceae bacterium]|nr:hypothetical protein [Rikenellaceae bacterium]